MPRFVNQDECVGCGTCTGECPVEAITLDEKASVNEDICIDCGACEVACLVSAISEK